MKSRILSGKTLILIFVLLVSTCLYSTIINVPADQPTIQEGIDASADTDTVLVADGTYFENINFEGKAITVASNYIIDADTLHIANTIINGSQPTNPNYASVVKFDSGESSTSVLSGFTLTEGTGSFEPGVGMFGGGISIHDSSPTLGNLIIRNNVISNTSGGSGIYCSMSSPFVYNVLIRENSSGFGAGFFCFGYSSPSLESVTIVDNSATDDGGGVFCNYNVNLSLENVTISGNSSDDDGGGICCWQNSDISLVNVLISDNFAADSGGGISFWLNCDLNLVDVTISGNSTNGEGGGIACLSNSYPNLINVTLSNNTANEGGGIYCGDSSEPELVNCVLWNNSPEEIYFNEEYAPNSITITYSDIEGGEAGIVTNNNGTVNWLVGNINENPLFVGAGDHPFMLQDLSPCVNVGIPDTTGLNLPEFDLAGNPRVYGGRIDMGAYENQNVIVNTDENLIPSVAILNQNYPNPFNPTTTISFTLNTENTEDIELVIYNLKGQRVKKLEISPESFREKLGINEVVWNGKDENDKRVSSGVYLYQLEVNDKPIASRKCLLLK